MWMPAYDCCVEHNNLTLPQQWHPLNHDPLTPHNISYGIAGSHLSNSAFYPLKLNSIQNALMSRYEKSAGLERRAGFPKLHTF